MKHLFVLLFFLLCFTVTAKVPPICSIPTPSLLIKSTEEKLSAASDTIVFLNGEVYRVRVIEVTSEKVFYKRYSDEEVRFFFIKDIKNILFDDGRIISFDYQPILPKPRRSAGEMYQLGYQQGKAFYDNRSHFRTGVVLGLFFWLYLLPLIAAAVISLNPPKSINLFSEDKRLQMGFADKEMTENFKDKNYLMGYERGAAGKKAAKIWLGVLTGIISFFAAFAALIGILVLIFASR